MDQEPDYGDPPLPPPTPEEEEAEAWEYWYRRAHELETILFEIRAAFGNFRQHANGRMTGLELAAFARLAQAVALKPERRET